MGVGGKGRNKHRGKRRRGKVGGGSREGRGGEGGREGKDEGRLEGMFLECGRARKQG